MNRLRGTLFAAARSSVGRGALACLLLGSLVLGAQGQGTGAPQTSTGTTTGTTTTTGTDGGATTAATTTGVATPPPATTPPAPTAAPAPTAPAPVPGTEIAQGAGADPVYGWEFFRSARALVDARRARAGQAGTDANALATAVGPEAFTAGNVLSTPTERYQLGPGDKLKIRYSSPTTAPVDATPVVSAVGDVVVPGIPQRFVVRGRTLDQFEAQLLTQLRRFLRNPSADVTLSELRTVPILVLGEAYAPGSYLVPSTVTLFNMLYAAGGPSANGTFRSIQLKRQGAPTRTYDLYRQFLKGDGSQDVPLQPGDVVFLPPVGPRVSVRGEVPRPGVFEARTGETIRQILGFAGGVRPSGITQRISVTSVRAGVERTLLDVDLRPPGTPGKGPAGGRTVLDGDLIEVFSIRSALANAVVVEGAVQTPRTYALTRGLRVRELIESARGLLPDAYLDRADLTRQNPDGTTRLVRVDLRRALRGDPTANVALQADDRLRVYTVEEIRSLGARRFQVEGAVRNPGTFARPDGATVEDALVFAGGLRDDAFRARATLRRTNADGTPGPAVAVNLSSKSDLALRLQDLDLLTVSSIRDAQFLPEFTVEIAGAVQRPGTFPLSEGLRVRDLLFQAGDPLPVANLNRAFVQRTNPDGTPGPLLSVDIARLFAGDQTQNVALQPRDRLTVYTFEQSNAQPDRTVEVAGAVQRPGSFPLSQNLRVRDLIALAGDPLPVANLDRAFIQRVNPDGTPGPLITVDLRRVLASDPAANLVLQPRDRLTLFTIEQSVAQPNRTVEIVGAVQRPGSFALSEGLRLSDVVALAGGPTLEANLAQVFVQRSNLDGTLGPLVVADLARIRSGDASADVALQPRDKVSVFTLAESRFRAPELVRVVGAVQRPGTFPASKGMTLRELLDLAGGPLPTAGDQIEISRAFQPDGTPPVRVSRRAVVEGSANAEVRPGDVVTFPANSTIAERPYVVNIVGSVRFPGPYIVDGRRTRISDLVRKAGGFLPEAFPKAAQFVREPQFVQTDAQRLLAPKVADLFRIVAEDEYKRASALADMDRLRTVFGSGSSVSGGAAPTLIPGIGGAAGAAASTVTPGISLDQALATSLRSEAATKARAFTGDDLRPLSNFGIRLENAVRRPGSADDLILEDGDVLVVPERPTSVVLTGAVVVPSAVLFEPGKPLDYYIQRAGGLAPDAAPRDVVIVRASGDLVRYRPGVRVELGDTVVVPTKVMAVRLQQRQGELERAANIFTSAGVTLALIRAISR